MVKYVIIYILSVIVASSSQILLKKSANIQRDSKIKEYLNIYVIGSYMMLVVSTILTLIAYQRLSLSMGVVLETIGYILIPIFSYIFFKEEIKKKQILGIIFIISGILIFSLL